MMQKDPKGHTLQLSLFSPPGTVKVKRVPLTRAKDMGWAR